MEAVITIVAHVADAVAQMIARFAWWRESA